MEGAKEFYFLNYDIWTQLQAPTLNFVRVMLEPWILCQK